MTDKSLLLEVRLWKILGFFVFAACERYNDPPNLPATECVFPVVALATFSAYNFFCCF